MLANIFEIFLIFENWHSQKIDIKIRSQANIGPLLTLWSFACIDVVIGAVSGALLFFSSPELFREIRFSSSPSVGEEPSDLPVICWVF